MNLAAKAAREANWVWMFRRPAACDEFRASTAPMISDTEMNATVSRANHRPPTSRRMTVTVAVPPTRRIGCEPAALTVSGGCLSPQPDGAQWRDPHDRGRREPVPRFVDGLDSAQVADTAAAVDVRVGVDDLVPAASVGETEAVALVRNGREVGDAGDR